MQKEILDNYIKAGRIAGEALVKSKEIVKPNAMVIDVCEELESFIRKSGGEPAFPVNISLNDAAAHYTAAKNDGLRISKNDVIKVDIGVHVDGYVGDTAHTIIFDPKYDKLVKASEAALQKAIELCKPGTKLSDISTAIDTCGYSSKKVYQDLLPYVDIVLLDIKVIDSDRHQEYTGVSNDTILENAKWISCYAKEHGKIMWIRTPLIPGYTATDENVKGIGEFIVNELNDIPDIWDLLAFNKLCAIKYTRLGISWPFENEPLITREEMEHFLNIAKSTGVKHVKWSGLTR